MNEKNPLQIYPKQSQSRHEKNLNKRGRPAFKDIKTFGPQPRSIIAQMLSEMRTNNIVEENTASHNEQSQDNVEDDETDYVCPTCSYRSYGSKEHKKHLSSHQQLLCDYPNCSYSCKLSSNLIKHKRVHTNEKPYLCDRCSFRTNFVNSLKAHKRTHTAEKPYQCTHCNYKCNSSSNLKKHITLRHSEQSKCKINKLSV